MNELYNIISIFVTSGLLLACGVMLLFAFIPANALLGNYRKARYTMAAAYLFFVAVSIAEYLSGDSSIQNVPLIQTVTLAIAASQAFLFTFAMLALVDVRFPGWRYIFREAAVVLLFIATLFTVYICCTEAFFYIAFYGFAFIYTLLLVRYTVLFIKSYRQFRYRMDNYYSDEESGRLRWVAFSFFASLVIGVMALLSAVFSFAIFVLIFAIIFDAFYIYFAIRLINYVHLFQVIERTIDDSATEEIIPPANDEPIADNNVKEDRTAIAVLEKQIELWVTNKGFTKQGITIDALAAMLNTNSKYLSTCINTGKRQTFREWINALRIEEAQNMLLKYPDMTINEIAEKTGFLDKSHFLRNFKKQNKLSPTGWKNRMQT